MLRRVIGHSGEWPLTGPGHAGNVYCSVWGSCFGCVPCMPGAAARTLYSSFVQDIPCLRAPFVRQFLSALTVLAAYRGVRPLFL